MSNNNIKRKFEDPETATEKKLNKLDFNIWNKNGNTDTSENATPKATKLGYNIWNKSGESAEALKKIKIDDLKLGRYTDVLRIKISYKSEKFPTRTGGQFFNFIGFDGINEMLITFFTKEVNKFFDLIQFNHIYDLTNFDVQLESKEFPTGLGTHFKIIANSATSLKETTDDTLPEIVFKFTPLEEIQNLEINSKCDIMAIICRDWGIEKTESGKVKRELSCTDKTKNVIVLSFWGSIAENINLPANSTSTVILRNGNVSQYDGKKYINCFSSAMVWWNPNISATIELKDWFDVEMQAE